MCSTVSRRRWITCLSVPRQCDTSRAIRLHTSMRISRNQLATIRLESIASPITISRSPISQPCRHALPFSSVGNAATYTSGSVAPQEWLTIFTPGPVTSVVAGELPATIVNSTATQTTVVLPNLPFPARNLIDPLLTTTLTIGSKSTVLPYGLAAPGIFTTSATGRGQGAILNQDLSINGAENAAERGSVISIYGTGVNGTATSVWIGSTQAQVDYSGPAPGLLDGIQQINVRIPADAPTGPAVPILVASGDEVSGGQVTVAIR